VTFWRALFTALSLLLLLPLFQGRAVFGKILRGGRALWVSGLCWSVMFTAFMVALTLTSVANVLITMAVGPLLTALIARVALGHKLTVRSWLAIVAAGVGIVYMYADQLAQGSLLGTLVALCVPIASAVNWTVTQHAHTAGQDVDLIPAVLVGACICTLATVGLAYPFQASTHDITLLGLLGVGQLAVPCVLAVVCSRVLKAPEISLLALLEVVFGIALAWLGAGEVPTPAVLIGGGLVVGALLTNELVGLRQRAQRL
jgi:drug/metabolite transporter (DMT)-like permease